MAYRQHPSAQCVSQLRNTLLSGPGTGPGSTSCLLRLRLFFTRCWKELNTALLLSSPWRRGLNWEHLESRSPSTMMDVSAVLGKLVEVVRKGSFLPPRKDPGKLSQLPGLLFEISAAPVRHIFHHWASAASSVCCEDERASSSLTFPDLHCVSV